MASFWKPEACSQTVLPDRSVLIGQKLVEKFKCDILGDFQTLWGVVLLQRPSSKRRMINVLLLFFCSQVNLVWESSVVSASAIPTTLCNWLMIMGKKSKNHTGARLNFCPLICIKIFFKFCVVLKSKSGFFARKFKHFTF